MTGPAPEKRIGDRERREVDAHLRQAHDDGVLTLTEYDERVGRCWAARTRRDLDVLTADLPDPVPEAPATPPARAAAPAAPAHRRRFPLGRTVVLGLAVLGGLQVVSADDAVAIFGGRTVQVAPGQERVEVGTLFGGVEVVVADDARVATSGFVVFGGVDCEAACDGTGTVPVTVDARGGFGGVEIVRQGERTRDDDDERDDD